MFDFKPKHKGLFAPGDFVVYAKGGDSHVGAVEIGVVKEVCDDYLVVAYGSGDTCSRTPFEKVVPVSNDFSMKALVERSEQTGRVLFGLEDGCEAWS